MEAAETTNQETTVEAINRILAGRSTRRDRRTVAKRLPEFTRLQLKALGFAETGSKSVRGRKTALVSQVRELLDY
jgi:hypothetical protein